MSDEGERNPYYDWVEITILSDPHPRWLRGPCRHIDVVPVESGGEVVAHLCLTCDSQLPGEWRA